MLGGTTTVLTMETVHGTDAVFDALVPTGLRAVVGKCLMDVARRRAGAPVAVHARGARREPGAARAVAGAAGRPAARGAGAAVRDFVLARSARSHGRAVSERGLLVHTHASEQREEVAIVRAQTGLDNVAYLAAVGLATERLCAAHCVWVTDAEQRLLAERHVKVLHCPGRI